MHPKQVVSCSQRDLKKAGETSRGRQGQVSLIICLTGKRRLGRDRVTERW